MPQLIVDDAQARIIEESAENLEICDRTGKHLGYVALGFTTEDIALAQQRRVSANGDTRHSKCCSHAIAGAAMTRYTVVWVESALNELADL